MPNDFIASDYNANIFLKHSKAGYDLVDCDGNNLRHMSISHINDALYNLSDGGELLGVAFGDKVKIYSTESSEICLSIQEAKGYFVHHIAFTNDKLLLVVCKSESSVGYKIVIYNAVSKEETVVEVSNDELLYVGRAEDKILLCTNKSIRYFTCIGEIAVSLELSAEFERRYVHLSLNPLDDYKIVYIAHSKIPFLYNAVELDVLNNKTRVLKKMSLFKYKTTFKMIKELEAML